jgi:exo-beta-1,3-glucanase (GH17 family)
MKQSPWRVFSIRAALAALLAVILVACGGGGGVPYSGVEIRPLSPEFTSRKAVAYGAYRTARNPSELDAEVITPAQLRQDLDLMLAAGFRLIRLFSSDDKVARQTLQVIADNNLNMKVQLGAFIRGDVNASQADKPAIDAANEASIAQAVALATNPAFKDIILAVSIGNETQVDFAGVRTNPETLARYLRTVRNQITQPVTTDDNWLAWARMPAVITNEVDFASIHIYAQLDTFFDPKLFDWRQKDVPEASRATAMMDAVMTETRRQYGQARASLDSKGLSYLPITVGETGWNVIDPRLSFRAHPVNQKMYFDRITAWANEGRNGPGPDAVFYFVAFDEQWKQGDDGWGLFNKERQARYAIQAINPNNSPAGSATWVWAPWWAHRSLPIGMCCTRTRCRAPPTCAPPGCDGTPSTAPPRHATSCRPTSVPATPPTAWKSRRSRPASAGACCANRGLARSMRAATCLSRRTARRTTCPAMRAPAP